MKRRSMSLCLGTLAAVLLAAAPGAMAAGRTPAPPKKVPHPAPAPIPPPSGPRAGTSIRIVVRAGALAVEQLGRVVPCTRDAVCAVLPSGKHVEGRLEDGRLIVELP